MTYYGETPVVDGDYTVVRFLESGDFITPDGVTEASKVLIVGGGADGGTWCGGGGGGGEVCEKTAVALSGTMIVTVGPGAPAPTANGPGASGSDSTFAGFTAKGGGGGGAYPTETGVSGGCGGGAAHDSTAAPGSSTASDGVGYGGGYGSASDSSGGGGGAGAAGAQGTSGRRGGAGGDGVSSAITGTATYYGGGGGGWGQDSTPASGGLGGGGAASRGDDGGTAQAQAGTSNTGGGGGGGWYQPNGYCGGAGGSGVVIVRYLTSTAPSDAATLTITSRHKVGFLATLDVTSRHRVRPLLFVRKTITSRHLVGYVYTPPPARLALRSRHRVDGAQGAARLTLTSRHAVAGLVRLTLTSRHLVRDVDPATLTLTSAHAVGGAARLALISRHKVARRSHIIPGSDPPVEVIDDMATYAAVNGIPVFVPVSWEPSGPDPEGDLILHHDGSLILHDVRPRRLCDMPVPIRVRGTSHTDLDAQEEAIRDACFAGGTFVWQSSGVDGDVGPLKSYLFAPSEKPGFARDKTREALHRSYGTMVLRVWPG